MLPLGELNRIRPASTLVGDDEADGSRDGEGPTVRGPLATGGVGAGAEPPECRPRPRATPATATIPAATPAETRRCRRRRAVRQAAPERSRSPAWAARSARAVRR